MELRPGRAATVSSVVLVLAVAGCNGGGGKSAVGGLTSGGSTARNGTGTSTGTVGTTSSGSTAAPGSWSTTTGAPPGSVPPGGVPAGTPGTWTTLATPMPAPRAWLAATVTDTGKIFLTGGADDANGIPTSDNIEFDPASQTFTPKAPMPRPRWKHGAAFLKGKIYVAGGSTHDAFEMLFGQPDAFQVDVYDVATDTWSSVPDMMSPRYELGVVTLGATIWALSGTETNSSGGLAIYVSDVFDPLRGTWAFGPSVAASVTPALPPAPAGMAIASIAPTLGFEGTAVTIAGTGLAGVTDVKIGGVSLANLVVTATQITGVLAAPSFIGPADVVAYSPAGDAVLAQAFAIPAISSDTSAVAADKVFAIYADSTSNNAMVFANAAPSTPFTNVGVFPIGNQARAIGLSGRLYVIGGEDPTNSFLTVNTVQSFDATATAPVLYRHAGLGTDRARGAVAASNGHIYVFGGDHGTPAPLPFPGAVAASYTSLASVEVFTP